MSRHCAWLRVPTMPSISRGASASWTVGFGLALWVLATQAQEETTQPPTPPRAASAPLQLPASSRMLSLARGVSLAVAAEWQPSGVSYSNATELVLRVPGPGPAPGVAPAPAAEAGVARMLITTETRSSFEDAVDRLQQIARSRDGTVRFFERDGWPAVEITFTEALPRRGQRATPPEPQTATRQITAVAVEASVVRVDVSTVQPELSVVRAAMASPVRALQSPSRPDPARARSSLQRLREAEATRAPGRSPPAPPASAPRTGDADAPGPSLVEAAPRVATGLAAVQAGVGEIEIAASPDARNIVIAANGGVSFSSNRGASFAASATGVFGPNDPSLARARSGNYYLATIAFPNGTPAHLNATGCTNAVSRSTDNGANFALQGYSARCPQSGTGVCFPDQEHIAADRVNTAAGGGDQVYAVWRNFTPSGTVASCRGIGSGFVTTSITCSRDNGVNWTATAAVAGAGDFPRVAVGRDGAVYVVTLDGNDVLLSRFSSCAAGLTQDAGFPVTVATLGGPVQCPVAGLDRCNDGNTLASPTVSADPGDANRVFVTFAERSGSGERVVARLSTNRGASFGAAQTLSAGNTARRFMPWSCAARGRVWAGWYDRTPATARGAANDLTDYFMGANGGAPFNLTQNADPQCASGWPTAPRAPGDADTCSAQPQLAGVCMTAAGASTGVRCDFDTAGSCAAGQVCSTGGGSPKYGDYNGIGCADNFVVAAWTSATAPAGLPAAAGGAGLRVFSNTVFIGEQGASIWRHTGVPCSGESCPGWQRIDNNPKTWSIVTAGAQLYQLHNDGEIWRFTGGPCDADACPHWQRLDRNPKTVAVVAGGGQLYQLHNDGWIWRHTGVACSGDSCPGWQRLDNNPATVALAANDSALYQLHHDGRIWRHTGVACSGDSCPGWQMLDNNRNTVAIVAAGSQLYQQHKDGRIWRHTGAACSGASCPGWQMLDNNPSTIGIVAGGGALFQLHRDGRIWRHTGVACSGASCPGWQLLDNNSKTVALVANGRELHQLHVDGAIWRFTGTACAGNSCPGWQRLDNNPRSSSLASGDQLFQLHSDPLYQLHDNGAVWRYTGTPCDGEFCPGWWRFDNNAQTVQIAATGGQLFQRHRDGRIWRSLGKPCSGDACPSWQMVDNNPATATIVAAGTQLYQLHTGGAIWRHDGRACTGSSCPGWRQLDRNPRTVAIAAGGHQLYQLHRDGVIWRYTGVPCSATACPGWERLDRNPATVAIAAAGHQLFQLHRDGRIWRHTGRACSGTSCPGWQMLDNNPATRAIAAAGAQLYQLHADGRIWRHTGVACSGNSCPGWQMLDNNPATRQIEATGNRLYQRHSDGRLWVYTGPPCSGSSCPGWRQLDDNPRTSALAAGGPR